MQNLRRLFFCFPALNSNGEKTGKGTRRLAGRLPGSGLWLCQPGELFGGFVVGAGRVII